MMVAPLQSSFYASAYPKLQHLTKAQADLLYAGIITVFPVLSGAGPPVSGQPGNPGQFYLDTNQNPNWIYMNVGTALVSSWMSLLSGNVV